MLWFLSVLLCSAIQLFGTEQTPILFPNADHVGVSSSLTILVRSPDAIDTTDGGFKIHPIILLRDSIARRTPRDQWMRYAINGKVHIVDEFTFGWKPYSLLPNTQYLCVYQNSEVRFTTAPDVPRIVSCSLVSHDVIQCDQAITLGYSSPIPDGQVLDSIIRIEQQNPNGTWSAVATVISPTSQGAIIRPTHRWRPNSQLRCSIRCSWYAGDVSLDRNYETMVRGSSDVTVEARTTDANPTPIELSDALRRNNKVVLSGDTLHLVAPRYFPPNFWFSHWTSDQIPDVNNDTSATTLVSVSCETMSRGLTISAMYTRVDSIPVMVVPDSLGEVRLFDLHGQIIQAAEHPSTLRTSAISGDIIFVAYPKPGCTFLGFSTTQAPFTPGALVIPSLKAQAMQNVVVNPRFQRLSPTVADMYRLKGAITDVDANPLFNAYDAVRFTTPYEFESTQSEERTMCVLADRCWEIIGYFDQVIGTPVWFDKGVQEYCLSTELMNPENNVVFFVRRKYIDVRVESVLLGSEDPRDILISKQPHDETRIEIQREENVRGMIEWVTIPTTHCAHLGIRSERCGVRCGDKLRLVIYPAKHRGQQWRWWSSIPKYCVPSSGPGNGANLKEYTLVADSDIALFDAKDCEGALLGHPEIRLQAAFRQEMIIESIGLRIRTNALGERSNARFEQRWFDPLTYYDRDPDEPVDGRQLEYVSRRGTPVFFRYSLPIDPESIYGGALQAESFDNILLTDPRANNLDFRVNADTSGNCNLLSSSGQFLDIVEFAICEPKSSPRKQALHTGAIDLTCNTSLRAFSGEPLRTQQTFALRRMELPGFGLKLRSMDLAEDGDWDFWPFINRGDIYLATYGGDMAPNRALKTEQGFTRIPSCDEQQGSKGSCTILHGDTDGPLGFGDKPLWLQTSYMGLSDLAWVTISTWDEDCKEDDNCIVNRIGGVIDSLKKRVSKYETPVNAAALDWNMLIPDLIKTGLDVIDAFVAPADQDDFLSSITYLEDSQTLWGMKGPTAPNFDVCHENATYHLKGQWYTSRAVVR